MEKAFGECHDRIPEHVDMHRTQDVDESEGVYYAYVLPRQCVILYALHCVAKEK